MRLRYKNLEQQISQIQQIFHSKVKSRTRAEVPASSDATLPVCDFYSIAVFLFIICEI